MSENQPESVPVARGQVFAAALEEMVSLVREVEARRKWGDTVAEFLKSKNLIEEFETFRKEKDNPAPELQPVQIEID